MRLTWIAAGSTSLTVVVALVFRVTGILPGWLFLTTVLSAVVAAVMASPVG